MPENISNRKALPKMTGTALIPLSPKEQAQLVNYNAATCALEKAVEFDDVKGIRDVGVAWRAYASQAKDTKLREMAEELRLRAERRAGEMLLGMKGRGELAPGISEGTVKVGGTGPGRKGATIKTPENINITRIADLGITRNQSADWQRLAKQSDEQFEQTVADAKVPRKRTATIVNNTNNSGPATVVDDTDAGNTPENSLLAIRKWAELAGCYAPEALKEARNNDYTDRAAVREVTQIINDLLKTWTKVLGVL
jgi:hypothetical protein